MNFIASHPLMPLRANHIHFKGILLFCIHQFVNMSQGQGSASSAEESLVDSQSGQDEFVFENSVTEQSADVNAFSTNISHNSISSDDDLKCGSSSRVSVESKSAKDLTNEASIRPVRATSLYLKKKESKISSLNLNSSKKINSHIRYLNQIQVDMAEVTALDT